MAILENLFMKNFKMTTPQKFCTSKISQIIVRLQNTGIYRIYNPKALAVMPKRSEGATKGLRVISFVVPCVLKSNFLYHRHVAVPLAAAVTTNHCENVAVISSNNGLLYLMRSGQCHLFYIALEAGIYCENK